MDLPLLFSRGCKQIIKGSEYETVVKEMNVLEKYLKSTQKSLLKDNLTILTTLKITVWRLAQNVSFYTEN